MMHLADGIKAMDGAAIDVYPVQHCFLRMPDWAFTQLHACIQNGAYLFRRHGGCFLWEECAIMQ
jgi:hypothetical protein